MNIKFQNIKSASDHQTWLSEVQTSINTRLPTTVLDALSELEKEWLIEVWSSDVETTIDSSLSVITAFLKAAVQQSLRRYEA